MNSGGESALPFGARASSLRAALPIIAGALFGFAALAIALGLQTRKADDVGLGLNTSSVFEPHAGRVFHLSAPAALDDVARDASRFGSARRVLWLGASQLYGVNAYRPGQHNVVYRVFDALIPSGIAPVALSLPLFYPQEQEIALAHALKQAWSGLVIAAVYPDMRHDTPREQITDLLEDPQTRARITRSEDGARMIQKADAADATRRMVQGPERDSESLMTRSEQALTHALERGFGFETARDAGRAMIRIALAEMRRSAESLRARMTRDLSRYRVPILPQDYQANLAAWRRILTTARAEGLPVLVYIAPHPTDFYPFDPDGYVRFKAQIETMARETGASFANIEDAVPNAEWGEVDLAFGFGVRDPYHFTARGHDLMARALLPHLRKAFAAP